MSSTPPVCPRNPQRARRAATVLCLVFVAAALPACAPRRSDEGTAPPPTSRQSPVMFAGAIPQPRAAAALPPAVTNGCMTSGFVPTDVPRYPLNNDTLANEPAIREPLCDPRAVTELEAIIECALPVGAKVDATLDDGTKLHFEGFWGLAPEWATGTCNRECQEWVTACYGVVLNAWGVHVRLLAKAPKAGTYYETTPVDLAREFTNQEGAFFGNLFSGGRPIVYSCRGRGSDPMYGAFRHCTLPDSPCDVAVEAVGTCDGVNGVTGEVTESWACEGVSESGFFTRCHSVLGTPGNWKGFTYTRPITIFTKTMSWGPKPSGC